MLGYLLFVLHEAFPLYDVLDIDNDLDGLQNVPTEAPVKGQDGLWSLLWKQSEPCSCTDKDDVPSIVNYFYDNTTYCLYMSES